MIDIYTIKGKYVVCYKAKINEEYCYTSFSHEDYSVVKKKYDDIKKNEIKVKYRFNEKQRIFDYAEAYLMNYGINEYAPYTLSKKIRLLYNYARDVLGEMKLKDLNDRNAQKIVDDFYNSQTKSLNQKKIGNNRLSITVVRKIQVILKYCLDGAVKHGIVDDNPFRRVDTISPFSVTPTQKEMNFKLMNTILQEHPNLMLYVLLSLMIVHRIDIQELLALSWKDVKATETKRTIYLRNCVKRISIYDMDNYDIVTYFDSAIREYNTTVVAVLKNRKEKTIEIDQRVLKIIREWKRKQKKYFKLAGLGKPVYVFETQTGKMYDIASVEKMIKKASERNLRLSDFKKVIETKYQDELLDSMDFRTAKIAFNRVYGSMGKIQNWCTKKGIPNSMRNPVINDDLTDAFDIDELINIMMDSDEIMDIIKGL